MKLRWPVDRWRVLIVSPDMVNRRKIASILEAWGLDTLCAATIRQARRLLTRQVIPLVFCEDRLADGGFENVVEAAKFSNANAQVVVMARTAEAQANTTREHGPVEVIPSPCYLNDVQWAVVHAMRRATQAQDAA